MNNILHEFAIVEHLVLLVPLVEFFGVGLLPVVDGIHVRSVFYGQEVEGVNLVDAFVQVFAAAKAANASKLNRTLFIVTSRFS